MFQNIGEMLVLLWRAIQAMPHLARHRHKVYDQLFEIGNASLLMACILSLFIGGVVSLQNRPALARRGLSGDNRGIWGNADWTGLPRRMMCILFAGGVALAMPVGTG